MKLTHTLALLLSMSALCVITTPHTSDSAQQSASVSHGLETARKDDVVALIRKSHAVGLAGMSLVHYDDAFITAQVKASWVSHPSVDTRKTQAQTLDRVVTLSGTVKNNAERILLSQLAMDIEGVVSVVNAMSIDAGIQPKAPRNLRVVTTPRLF